MVLILAGLLIGAALPCNAQAPAAPEALMRKLMNAVESNDYASFVADGIPEFKRNVTPEVMDDVSKRLAHRMKEGYECIYLTEMNQKEYKVYLWKVAFKDGGDDALIKMVVLIDQLAGFWIQ
jgi:hypothetical protein